MKVKVIKQYKVLENILDVGDIIELKIKRSTKEKVLFPDQFHIDKITGKRTLVNSALIAPIGNFEGFTFKAKNGGVYSDDWLINCIGHYDINQLFKKIS